LTPMTNKDLPAHLQGITRVVADAGLENAAIIKRVRARLQDTPWSTRSPENDPVRNGPVRAEPGETVLYLKRYLGKFLRFCPGTRHYHCCGYRIIHIGENCPLSCSYCILKAYFQDRVLKVWANQDDLFNELDAEFGANPGRRYRTGTGEFTDSLALEALTGYSRDLISFLSNHENVCLELKSKVIDLSWMDAAARPDRVLPAWSMNAPQVRDLEERGASSLEERLSAARTCAQAGFRVCLHFDPILYFPGWEKGYTQAVDMIFDYLRPRDLAYVSLGSFRFMPDLKKTIEAQFPESKYIYGEFVTGLDGKQRLVRPLRAAQFKLVADRFKKYGVSEALYFCMESEKVWRAVFGYAPKDLGGLAGHLMRRAFGE